MGYHGLNDGKWLARNELAGELHDNDYKRAIESLDKLFSARYKDQDRRSAYARGLSFEALSNIIQEMTQNQSQHELLLEQKKLIIDTWKISQKLYEDILLEQKKLDSFHKSIFLLNIANSKFHDLERNTKDIEKFLKQNKSEVISILKELIEAETFYFNRFNDDKEVIAVFRQKLRDITALLLKFNRKWKEMTGKDCEINSYIDVMRDYIDLAGHFIDDEWLNTIPEDIKKQKNILNVLMNADDVELSKVYSSFYAEATKANALGWTMCIDLRTQQALTEYKTLHTNLTHLAHKYINISS